VVTELIVDSIVGEAPDPDSSEWILYQQPQVALRVVRRPVGIGTARVGIGVDDLPLNETASARPSTVYRRFSLSRA